MLLPLLRSELFKVSHRAMPRILLLILVGLVVLLYLVFLLVVRTGADSGTDPQTVEEMREALRVAEAPDNGLGMVQQVGTVLAVILGVSIISNEYSWGTIRLILPRVGNRGMVLASKLVVALLFVAVLVVVGFLVALASSFVASTLEDLSTNVGDGFVVDSLAAMVRTGYTMLPYVAIGFFVAVFTRSTAAGIAVALSVLFLEGLVSAGLAALPSPFDTVSDVLLSRNVAGVLNANSVAGGFDDDTNSDLPGAWQAAAVLALYIAAPIITAYVVFTRRDVTSTAGT